MRLTPEDKASKAMARCVVENSGENVAFYLAEAIQAERTEATRIERERCAGIARQWVNEHEAFYGGSKTALVIAEEIERGDTQ